VLEGGFITAWSNTLYRLMSRERQFNSLAGLSPSTRRTYSDDLFARHRPNR